MRRSIFSKENHFVAYKDVCSILVTGEESASAKKFSIVIPTYNRVDTLKDTIHSALNQKECTDYDIIICDNNPERNDETEEYVTSINDPKVFYYKNTENIGLFGNLNRCGELCRGDYFICIHDDDVLYENYLAEINRLLQKVPNADVIYCQKHFWNQLEIPLKPEEIRVKGKCRLQRLGLVDCVIDEPSPPTGVLVKKKSFMDIGGYETDSYPSGDYSFAAKAIKYLEVYKYHKPLYYYRNAVNASLKFNTQRDMMVQGVMMRKELMDEVKLPKRLKEAFWHVYFTKKKILFASFKEKLGNEDLALFCLPSSRWTFFIDRLCTRSLEVLLLIRKNLSCKV